MTWQPSAALATLRRRAQLLATIREFFASRDVLEVETPLLCSAGVTDPALEAMTVDTGDSLDAPRYLQTSPEYAMKRLLAAHGEAVYQVARAFRDGEAGSRHNPEFTLLEWYRPGFDAQQLMDEVEQLLRACLEHRDVSRTSYRALFLDELDIDPMTAGEAALEALVREHIDVGDLQGGRDTWLDLMVSHVLEPRLAQRGAVFVFDYPASQAALARIVERDGVRVGERFELYVDGLELANGYCELTDAAEQRARFEADNARRRALGLAELPLDEHLLAALAMGMPACSGVALGLDRLLMLACGVSDIREVLAFEWGRA